MRLVSLFQLCFFILTFTCYDNTNISLSLTRLSSQGANLIKELHQVLNRFFNWLVAVIALISCESGKVLFKLQSKLFCYDGPRFNNLCLFPAMRCCHNVAAPHYKLFPDRNHSSASMCYLCLNFELHFIHHFVGCFCLMVMCLWNQWSL